MKFNRNQYKDLYCPDCRVVQRHSVSNEGGLQVYTCLVCGSEQCEKHADQKKHDRRRETER